MESKLVLLSMFLAFLPLDLSANIKDSFDSKNSLISKKYYFKEVFCWNLFNSFRGSTYNLIKCDLDGDGYADVLRGHLIKGYGTLNPVMELEPSFIGRDKDHNGLFEEEKGEVWFIK